MSGGAVTQFDPLIHQPARLRIMAALSALGPGHEVEFSLLQKALGFTPGNLGSHLRKLEAAGYIEVRKTFVQRRPRTYIRLTERGAQAFQGHVRALQALLHTPPPTSPPDPQDAI